MKPRAEAEFAEKAREMGWDVRCSGWPDFIGRDANGKLVAIEVKNSPSDNLRSDQIEVALMLIEAGIDCYRYDPQRGLIPILDDPVAKKPTNFYPRKRSSRKLIDRPLSQLYPALRAKA